MATSKAPSVLTVLAGIKQHESGGDYKAQNPSSTASGAYQYLDSTWNGYGGYARAADAPPAVQDARARQDVEANYKKYGDWRKVVAAHFAGSGWVDAHPNVATWDQNPAPGSNNPTVSEYVSSVLGGSAGSTGSGKGTTPTNPLGAQVQTATPQYTADPTLSIKQYGYIAALAHSNPELAQLMAKYANEDLNNSAVQQRLAGEIQNTAWYKKTTDSQRAAQILQAQNPTEYHRQFANTLLTVTDLANKLGVHLPGLGLHDFAVNAYNNGWTPAEQQHFLLAQAQYKPDPKTGTGQPTGDIGQTLTSIGDQANQYMVPISDQTKQKWAADIMNGRVNANDYTNYLKEQAKSLFPGMSAAIDSGVTPTQYTDPYKQIAAQTLEVAPDSVNFNDPKWSKALFQVDPKTGARTSMSLADWGKTLRSDPIYGYSKTQGAQTQAADFAENILNTFGAVGNYGGNG
jgi:hypothetical protein